MKQFVLPPALSICFALLSNQFIPGGPVVHLSFNDDKNITAVISQDEPNRYKMPAAAFKAQGYCRAEIPDFAFDVHFDVVSATVYFTGANFKTVQTGYITSSSLKPISQFMEQCAPGSIIIFDDFKVIGPDKRLRTIQPMSIVLY
jgi:hypothetical protein